MHENVVVVVGYMEMFLKEIVSRIRCSEKNSPSASSRARASAACAACLHITSSIVGSSEFFP